MRRAFTPGPFPNRAGRLAAANFASVAFSRSRCSVVSSLLLSGGATFGPVCRATARAQSGVTVQTAPVSPTNPSCVSLTVSGAQSRARALSDPRNPGAKKTAAMATSAAGRLDCGFSGDRDIGEVCILADLRSRERKMGPLPIFLRESTSFTHLRYRLPGRLGAVYASRRPCGQRYG